MTKQEFTFDFHIHVPPRRIEETVRVAIDRGLDALCLTGYSPKGDIKNFDYAAENKGPDNQPVLTPNQWDVQRISPVVLKATNEQGRIYLLKGGELNSRGHKHLLCLGIRENKTEGQNPEDMLSDTNKQGGVAVFPHLYMAGCGEEVYLEMARKFPGYLTGLEINAQFPRGGIMPFNAVNRQSRHLASEQGSAIFGFSDIHGHYRKEQKKVGDLLYSSVPSTLVNPEHMEKSFREIMLHHKNQIQIHGRHAKTRELFAWKGTSLFMELTGQKKSQDFK